MNSTSASRFVDTAIQHICTLDSFRTVEYLLRTSMLIHDFENWCNVHISPNLDTDGVMTVVWAASLQIGPATYGHGLPTQYGFLFYEFSRIGEEVGIKTKTYELVSKFPFYEFGKMAASTFRIRTWDNSQPGDAELLSSIKQYVEKLHNNSYGNVPLNHPSSASSWYTPQVSSPICPQARLSA